MPVKKKRIKTPKQVAALIKRRNKVFNRATLAEKRVLIAKDVLEQLKLKVIVAESGVYFKSRQIEDLTDFSFRRNGEETQANYEKGLREAVLSGEVNRCRACAKGSLLLSCVLYRNQVKLGDAMDALDGRMPTAGLNRIFTEAQLDLMEDVFEDNLCDDEKALYPKLAKMARIGSDRRRLTAIMRNVIKNKGTFQD